MVPQLVADRDLESANATLGLGTHGLDALGPALAAVLLPLLGIRGVLLADAGTFVVSATLLLALPSLYAKAEGADALVNPLAFGKDIQDGLLAIWDHALIRTVAIGFCIVVAFTGVDDVALVFLAREMHGGDVGASVLYMGSGVGMLLSFAALAHVQKRAPALVLVVAGLAIGSAGNGLTGVAWAIVTAAEAGLRGSGARRPCHRHRHGAHASARQGQCHLSTCDMGTRLQRVLVDGTYDLRVDEVVEAGAGLTYGVFRRRGVH